MIYKALRLLKASFVSEKSNKYRDKLKGQISEYFGCDNVLLTSSGRCAIYQILVSLPQKKVIVPAYTCEVVIDACRLANKEITFAHVDRETLNVSEYPEINSDTAVIATHQYGLPCEIKNLAAYCKEQGAVLVEDCAGSLGSKIDGQLTGTFGDFGVFSFSASKTLHSPTKGGFIIAKDAEALKKVEAAVELKPCDVKFKAKQILKGFGFCLNNNRLFAEIIGKVRKGDDSVADNAYLRDPSYKRGFYEWQAYVVSKQFEKLNGIMTARLEMFKEYERWIDNPLVLKPVYNEDAVNIRYAIQVEDRKSFIEHCRRNKIQVGKGYKKLMCPDTYTVEKKISNDIVYLPFGSEYSHKEIQKVIYVVNSYK